MNPSQSKFCEGPGVLPDDPRPFHLRCYAMQSSEDPAGWNVGIVDDGVGEASASVGGVFRTEILRVRVLPLLEPNLLYHAVVCICNKSHCRFSLCLRKTTLRLVLSLKPASYNTRKGLDGMKRDLVRCAI